MGEKKTKAKDASGLNPNVVRPEAAGGSCWCQMCTCECELKTMKGNTYIRREATSA
jgi:hypothetical protein